MPTFLETKFPSKGDIDRTVIFYDVVDYHENHKIKEVMNKKLYFSC